MAGGMNKRGSGIPMHQRVALGHSPAPEAPASDPGPAVPDGRPGDDDSPGRHCWVLVPADGSGRRRPGLLVEWRRDDEGHWSGRVVYVVRLRTGRWALLDEWLPQSDIAPP
jgi:hypothetical protein